MDILAILEQFGVPVVVAMAFGFFIWKQNKFIQDELTKEIRESFSRLEKITIDLINAQKNHSIDLRGLEKSFDALIKIIKSIRGLK